MAKYDRTSAGVGHTCPLIMAVSWADAGRVGSGRVTTEALVVAVCGDQLLVLLLLALIWK